MTSVEKKKILMSTIALICFVVVQGLFQNFVQHKTPLTSISDMESIKHN